MEDTTEKSTYFYLTFYHICDTPFHQVTWRERKTPFVIALPITNSHFLCLCGTFLPFIPYLYYICITLPYGIPSAWLNLWTTNLHTDSSPSTRDQHL